MLHGGTLALLSLAALGARAAGATLSSAVLSGAAHCGAGPGDACMDCRGGGGRLHFDPLLADGLGYTTCIHVDDLPKQQPADLAPQGPLTLLLGSIGCVALLLAHLRKTAAEPDAAAPILKEPETSKPVLLRNTQSFEARKCAKSERSEKDK